MMRTCRPRAGLDEATNRLHDRIELDSNHPVVFVRRTDLPEVIPHLVNERDAVSDPRSLREHLGHTSVSLREHGSPRGAVLLVGSIGSAEGRAATVSRAETSRAPRAVGTSLGMAQSRTRQVGPGVSHHPAPALNAMPPSRVRLAAA